MTNRQIVNQINAFRYARAVWVNQLLHSDSVSAAQRVLSCNTKIEYLLAQWNWSDVSVDYPYPN